VILIAAAILVVAAISQHRSGLRGSRVAAAHAGTATDSVLTAGVGSGSSPELSTPELREPALR
jgi:hypothetical protein